MGVVAGPLAAGLAVAAWTAVFRGYGVFDFADEGTLLAQALRTAHGERPYVDFHTGYGPLHFAVYGWLVAHGGLGTVRSFLVLVHGATAAAVFAATRRLAGTAVAGLAVAVSAAFLLPVAPRQGAPFLTPYPAWLAGLAGLGCLLLLDRRHGLPSVVRAAAAGLLAGATFAMKPNSGLLVAGGAVATIVLGAACSGREAVGARAEGGGTATRGAAAAPAGPGPFGAVMLGLLAVGALVIVWPPGGSVLWWALVLPVVVIAASGLRRGVPDAASVPLVVALAAGFVAVSVPAFAPSMAALGPAAFARDALLVGSPVAAVYGVAYPMPALGAVGAGLLAFLGRRRPAVALGAVALAAAALDGAAGAPALAAALRLGAERALMVAVPLVTWGGAVLLAHGSGPGIVAPAAIAVTAALQLHPRPDLLHLMPVGPALVPLAARIAREAAEAWAPWTPRVLAVAAAAVAAVRVMPGVLTAATILAGRVATVPAAGGTLVIDPVAAPRLDALAAAADAVATRTTPEQRVATFPACAIVPFLAGRLPAGPHDYFFPGRPDRAAAAALADTLAAAPPPVAVTCDAAGTDLASAWTAYPEMVAFLEERYEPVVVVPPFVVHVLRQAVGPHGPAASDARMAP